MIEFNCDHCGHGIRVQENAAGKSGNCKKCGQRITVPHLAPTTGITTELLVAAIQPCDEPFKVLLWRFEVAQGVLAVLGVLPFLFLASGGFGWLNLDRATACWRVGTALLLSALIACLYGVALREELKRCTAKGQSPTHFSVICRATLFGVIFVAVGGIAWMVFFNDMPDFLSVDASQNLNARGEVADRKSKKIRAWTMATEFVSEHLKSPGTANYGGILDYQDPEKCVTILANGEYDVVGWVDAQNAFGAKLRSHFSIRIKDKGNGSWGLIGEPSFTQR